MAFSSSPYALLAYLSPPPSKKLSSCLPNTLSAPGVLFYGIGPYYLLPKSNVDIRSLLTYTSFFKQPNSSGYFISPGYVKVQAAITEEGYSTYHVARQSNEVKNLDDALGGPNSSMTTKNIKFSKKISRHNSMSHPSSNPPSRYQTTGARVRNTAIDEPMPSQAPLIGHGHYQMVVLD
nr:basic 7S globulin 2-like [Tanacetum cinerariifolium]